MNQHTIYRKTAKGSEAITARLHGVVGKSRSLLILVDGKRTSSELHTLGQGFGDVTPLLAQLERDGFIETLSPPPPPPVAQERVAAPAAAPKAPLTLAEAKAFAARRLMQMMGPTSEPLCLRIEAARNTNEFIEAIKRAYAVVREIRGPAEAERFGAAVEDNLPAL